ncbi:N-acetylglucosamine kinase [Antribacter gilvus]|uniref:N-acetylglucosamine kinase n=1 Tax=Antribacter gilvus TaxID=2304675 RepID=UPI0013DFE509|nr:BadF/BadG/BcrA/BcrD ATPase family protein [Antribacter gilvus]
MTEFTQGDITADDSADSWIVAVDVGGSGSRLVAVQGRGGERIQLEGRRVEILPDGSDAAEVVASLCRSFVAWAVRTGHQGGAIGQDRPRVAAAAVGVTGLKSLVENPNDIHDALATELRTNRSAVAGDALTAHLGALRGRPGAVLSVGTGSVALAWDKTGRWHRADGWGHVFGDLGAGAWIGSAALRAATAAHDGRPRGGSPYLLESVTARLGPVATWPAQVYKTNDRAGRLAALAPAVMAAARAGDRISEQILVEAGRHLATTLVTALAPGIPPMASTTGSLVQEDSPLTHTLAEQLAEERPEVQLVPSAGTPLDGALHLARHLRDNAARMVAYRPWLTVRIDGRGAAGGTEDTGAMALDQDLTGEASADGMGIPPEFRQLRISRPTPGDF